MSGIGLLGVRVAAGVTTGTLAILAAQPTDVVKVRMQAGGGAARYNGVMDAYSTILRNEVENLKYIKSLTRTNLYFCFDWYILHSSLGHGFGPVPRDAAQHRPELHHQRGGDGGVRRGEVRAAGEREDAGRRALPLRLRGCGRRHRYLRGQPGRRDKNKVGIIYNIYVEYLFY